MLVVAGLSHRALHARRWIGSTTTIPVPSPKHYGKRNASTGTTASASWSAAAAETAAAAAAGAAAATAAAPRKRGVLTRRRWRRRSGRRGGAAATTMGLLPSDGPERAAERREDGKSESWELVGCKEFVRKNPRSDKFRSEGFHHVEFWCGDASNTWRRFSWGMGMRAVAKSDQSTGNQVYCSYALKSHDLVFAFTAPYSERIDRSSSRAPPHPGYEPRAARAFFQRHGLAVRAVGIAVEDTAAAFRTAVENGAVPVLEPTVLTDDDGGGSMTIAEVELYGDVVLRFVSSHGFKGPYLPNFRPVDSQPISYGIRRLDHAVGNVVSIRDAAAYLGGFTGFHEFAEFTADDVGTAESGLNSVVLANNSETVLLPLNEPVFGTKRKSQIQTYLEHNEGPGLQHLALACDDIFATMREMRMRTQLGGFDFMPKPPPTYYKNLPARVGPVLTAQQCQDCAELGILVDKDDQGVLLQVFTKPLGDRPTIFIEIIQRVGCMEADADGRVVQRGGCGGFGKGNFSELFKSIEEYEKTLDGTCINK